MSAARDVDVAVTGAGQAGLAVGFWLRRPEGIVVSLTERIE